MSDITLKTFKRNLAIYGSDFNLWQGGDVDALRSFLREDAGALDLYLQAQSLDAQLDDFTVPALNTGVVAAARAQIVREAQYAASQAEARDEGGLRTGVMGTVFGLWGRALKPAYALASIVAVVLVVALLAQNDFAAERAALLGAQGAASDAQPIVLARVDDALDEIENLAVESETHQELILAFAEIEKEQDINKFMDYIILEFDDVLMEDALEYLNQEG